MEDGFLDDGRGDQTLHSGLGSPHCFSHQNGERVERYSRKVFVGGLPPDIDEGKNLTQGSSAPQGQSWALTPFVCELRGGCFPSFDMEMDLPRVVRREIIQMSLGCSVVLPPKNKISLPHVKLTAAG